jgi:hypothetical protein
LFTEENTSCQQRKRLRRRKRNTKRLARTISQSKDFGLAREAPLAGLFSVGEQKDVSKIGVQLWELVIFGVVGGRSLMIETP